MPKPASALALLLTTLLCLSLDGHPAQADDPPTQQHQALYPATYVPLKRGHVVGGQPVIPSMLNGTQPAAFLVDTGGGFCILSPEMVDRLHLKRQPATMNGGLRYLFQGKQVSAVSASTIKFGNLTITINRGDFRVLDDQNFMLFPVASDHPLLDKERVCKHYSVYRSGLFQSERSSRVRSPGRSLNGNKGGEEWVSDLTLA